MIPRRHEVGAGLFLVFFMAFSWWLVHGLLIARCNQFVPLGEPPFLAVEGSQPAASQNGPYALLNSEAAFHFRTTLMFAVDDYQDPETLHHDRWQQYPDGVDSWREYGILMEPVYGFLYRAFPAPGRSLPDFLLVLVPLVFASTLVPVYLLARILGVRAGFALVGVALYALSPLAFNAILTALLVKETFSLLVFAAFLAAHFRALRRQDVTASLVAAGLLGVFLVSWHLSQFLAAAVLASTAAATLFGKPAGRRGLLQPLAYLVAALLAGSTPLLAARYYLVSPPLVPLYVWLLLAAAPSARFGTIRSRLLLGAVGIVVFALVAVKLAPGPDYSHVYGLLREQLVHGFVKPTDPRELPFAVRMFWAMPFTPPVPGRLWLQCGFAGLVLAAATGWFLISHAWRSADPSRRAFCFLVLGLLAAWALSERLGPVFLLLAPAVVGLAIQGLVERFADRRLRGVVVAVAVLVILANVPLRMFRLIETSWAVTAGKSVTPRGLDVSESADRAALFDWIIANTPGPGSDLPGDPAAFAADIALSPALLLYSARPVVLNSQFENEKIRRRTEVWLESLFAEDESALLAFLARVRADYLVIDRDLATATGRWSPRYMVGSAAPANATCVAGRLHFSPESVRGLRPVYGNDHYRVFRVGDNSSNGTWPRSHGRWWTPANFEIRGGRLVDPHRDRLELQRIENELRAVRGQLDRIAAHLAPRAAGSAPSLIELRRQEAEFVVAARLAGGSVALPADLKRAIGGWLRTVNPRSGGGLQTELDQVLDGSGEGRTGLLALLHERVPEPADEQLAADLCVLAGRFGEAGSAYLRLAALVPGAPVDVPQPDAPRKHEALAEAARWFLVAGRTGEAVASADLALQLAAPDTGRDEFLEQVRRLGAGR